MQVEFRFLIFCVVKDHGGNEEAHDVDWYESQVAVLNLVCFVEHMSNL